MWPNILTHLILYLKRFCAFSPKLFLNCGFLSLLHNMYWEHNTGPGLNTRQTVVNLKTSQHPRSFQVRRRQVNHFLRRYEVVTLQSVMAETTGAPRRTMLVLIWWAGHPEQSPWWAEGGDTGVGEIGREPPGWASVWEGAVRQQARHILGVACRLVWLQGSGEDHWKMAVGQDRKLGVKESDFGRFLN